MFDFNNIEIKGNNQRLVPEKFVIIYDKLTKPVAISLRNSMNGKYTCAVWDKKTYDANEAKLSSQNYLLILSEELFEQNLANPKLKPIKYINGIIMLVEGNTLGFKYDPNTSPKTLNQILYGSWKTYLDGVIAPILIAVDVLVKIMIIALFAKLYFIPTTERIKLKLFFDAVDKSTKESLELFLNGKLG